MNHKLEYFCQLRVNDSKNYLCFDKALAPFNWITLKARSAHLNRNCSERLNVMQSEGFDVLFFFVINKMTHDLDSSRESWINHEINVNTKNCELGCCFCLIEPTLHSTTKISEKISGSTFTSSFCLGIKLTRERK